ncbi:peptidase M24 [Lactarius indigo]|nr:peptidase M24 [Lactarius indigo]
MSLRSCSLRLVQPVRLPRHCAYATQVHPHHLVTKPSAFGQPTLKSHPHLVKPGELTPGIPASEYERRRKQLVDGLPHGSLVVCVAGQVKYMSAAIFYKFRQASDFWYLTGFEEPDSALILRSTGTPRGFRMLLYSTGKDPSKEKWDGAFTRFQDVLRPLRRGLKARPLENFADDLRTFAARAEHVYCRRALRTTAVAQAQDAAYCATSPGSSLAPPGPTPTPLRSVKSTHEQEVMKASADISARAHAKTMRFAQPGLSEADLQAHFEYTCARSGVQRPAYVPVVASGENALVIHYTRNDHLLRDGELGALRRWWGIQWLCLLTSVTRTFPVNGTFTSPQRELYAALLATQKALVKECAVARGHSLDTLHRRSVDLLRAELGKIGLPCEGHVLERVLYPHYLTHPIGIGKLARVGDRREECTEGMVITIEPGVYVPADPQFPKHFHGLGMRIEDEVLVGAEHPVVLSANAPKEVEDVEGTCQGALGFGPF